MDGMNSPAFHLHQSSRIADTLWSTCNYRSDCAGAMRLLGTSTLLPRNASAPDGSSLPSCGTPIQDATSVDSAMLIMAAHSARTFKNR